MFTKESDFETALAQLLTEHGWEKEILYNYTEQQLVQNWADILFENNCSIDRLNGYRLTKGEMQQLLDQITALKTPLNLNGFINGYSVTITRDNEEDKLHYGKAVSLKIYDRMEIAAGQSRYQIVRQPKFPTKSKILNDRRGDMMLLINGMPVIHIELKKSGVPVSQGYNQIEKYAREGIFTGLFALVQIFVAMNPEETVYFANPGPDGKFNPDFYFHWADFDNVPINDWKRIASTLLSIPMAHQLIGFYTVADGGDNMLKVMRSYQYYAANAISDKVAQTKWDEANQLGGHIWHTTGSGKTMTSFKSAQLIAMSKDADKVIFLMDRIELGTQSLKEYRGFADDSEDVQGTENTQVLIDKLKSNNPSDTLIVTSIQKMSNIKNEADSLQSADIHRISSKRLVFIVDECHRSTFGDMLQTIKQTFPKALFFGFSGTPIQNENQKKMNTTADVFGSELHRYSIADGIRDGNVLGFDPYKVSTYKERDVRSAVALDMVNAATEQEAIADPKKKEKFYEYMMLVPMAGARDKEGVYHKGIEDYLSNAQYNRAEHQNCVVKDIVDNWATLSRNSYFHAIFATSSIPEAIVYYRLFKEEAPGLKVTALFDPNIDNDDGDKSAFKEDGLEEIILDYNKRYEQDFSLGSFAKMKKDIANRLAHKQPYNNVATEKQIDILIVVDQMLTGFDSKWINTLYLDKLLEYEGLIQAFSRTNRLFGPDKPFGTIRYYRRPNTMERNIANAIKLYSGDKVWGLFVQKLPKNIESMNYFFQQIKDVFTSAGVEDFSRLPQEAEAVAKFVKLFGELNDYLEAAKVQGFVWEKLEYTFTDEQTGAEAVYTVLMDKKTYYTLVQRYKEISGDNPNPISEGIAYDIRTYITEINTDKIDVDYMNSKFTKYLKLKRLNNCDGEELRKTEEELHKTFATLTQEEQRYAKIFLNDIQRGNIVPQEGKTMRDYITEYVARAKNDNIHRLAEVLGANEALLRKFMELDITESNIDEYGRFSALRSSVDRAKAKEYFEALEGTKIIPPRVMQKATALLRSFILAGGFDVEVPAQK